MSLSVSFTHTGGLVITTYDIIISTCIICVPFCSHNLWIMLVFYQTPDINIIYDLCMGDLGLVIEHQLSLVNVKQSN